MEQFVYHRKVEEFKGSILYPLNQLKEIFPEIYNAHVQKYTGREHVLETKIPAPLDCLWNDVLHFTAVHPETLYMNLKNAGFTPEEFIHKQWFKVPISLFDFEKLAVCLYRRDVRLVPDARDFHPFAPEKMQEYATMPPETIKYYKEQKALEKRPLFFHHVPHVLYKGTVDTTGLEIVQI